ncbi:MAG: ribulose-phosphate 3-epimerase [Oscillospiraceae bacterium]|nr:ribulose-phosphate 3-epimerase [Oscillospiraceae bacterium]
MSSVWEESCILAPSLICLDLCNLERDVNILRDCDIDVLHVDILDGHFSPSMPIGLDVVKQLRQKTELVFDVHIMTTTPDYFLDEMIEIGAEQITVHYETLNHADRIIDKIKNAGIRAGLALKPATTLHVLDYIIDKLDNVLLMQINPGYAGYSGQTAAPYMERKIKELYEMISRTGCKTSIQLDGRVTKETIDKYANKEVCSFVVGSSCFSKNNLRQTVTELADYQKLLRKVKK